MVEITDTHNLKADLEQSYRTMKNYRATFPYRKPSSLERRTAVFQIAPTLSGAVRFVAREQGRIQSCLPQQWQSHFEPFPFPIEEQWNDVPSKESCGIPYDNNGPSRASCGTPQATSTVKSMVNIDKHTGIKASACFDYLRTSLTFDLAGLTLFVETACGACSDVQIIMDDTRIHVLALSEEAKETDVNGACGYREVTDVTGAYNCYVLRHYCRTFHLPHPIEQGGASIQQESNVMRIFIPWK